MDSFSKMNLNKAVILNEVKELQISNSNRMPMKNVEVTNDSSYILAFEVPFPMHRDSG